MMHAEYEEAKENLEEEFFPSLVSMSTDLVSRNLTVETALDTYM
jgi:hypothetical protein